jgi:methionine synthase II (cobalamin-independent)
MMRPPPFRAEHIGSLLRPPELLRAREQHAAGELDRKGLAAIENAAIARVVKLQEDVGLHVVTDGEFRRGTYSDAFTSAGISGVKIEMTEERGWSRSQSHGHRMARRIPTVVGRIAWKGPQNADDFRFLKSLTTRTPKITLPGPCYIHYRAGRANISRDVYPDLDAFWSDLVEAYVQEMRSLADAGCRYLQIDETSLVKLGDPRVRRLLAERGDDWRDLLRIYVDVVNAVVAGAREGMTIWDSRLPQPGSELASGRRLRSHRGAAIQRDEGRQLFSRIRQRARRDVRTAAIRAGGKIRGARPRRLQGCRTGERRLPQAADRGGKPLRQARATRLERAMRVRDQRRRARHGDGGDRTGEACPHRRGCAAGLGQRVTLLASG